MSVLEKPNSKQKKVVIPYHQQRGEVPGGGVTLVPYGEYVFPWPSDEAIALALQEAQTTCEFPECDAIATHALANISNNLPYLCDLHFKLCTTPGTLAGDALRSLRYHLRGLLIAYQADAITSSRQRTAAALSIPFAALAKNQGISHDEMVHLRRPKLGQ